MRCRRTARVLVYATLHASATVLYDTLELLPDVAVREGEVAVDLCRDDDGIGAALGRQVGDERLGVLLLGEYRPLLAVLVRTRDLDIAAAQGLKGAREALVRRVGERAIKPGLAQLAAIKVLLLRGALGVEAARLVVAARTWGRWRHGALVADGQGVGIGAWGQGVSKGEASARSRLTCHVALGGVVELRAGEDGRRDGERAGGGGSL